MEASEIREQSRNGGWERSIWESPMAEIATMIARQIMNPRTQDHEALLDDAIHTWPIAVLAGNSIVSAIAAR
jgi:hypothetical protein